MKLANLPDFFYVKHYLQEYCLNLATTVHACFVKLEKKFQPTIWLICEKVIYRN